LTSEFQQKLLVAVVGREAFTLIAFFVFVAAKEHFLDFAGLLESQAAGEGVVQGHQEEGIIDGQHDLQSLGVSHQCHFFEGRHLAHQFLVLLRDVLKHVLADLLVVAGEAGLSAVDPPLIQLLLHSLLDLLGQLLNLRLHEKFEFVLFWALGLKLRLTLEELKNFGFVAGGVSQA
jgi:hypothetical protein